MSQMGMQIPGARRRSTSLDIYTGLGFLAVVFLIVACVVVWQAASKVGKDGDALSLQEPGRISIKKPAN